MIWFWVSLASIIGALLTYGAVHDRRRRGKAQFDVEQLARGNRPLHPGSAELPPTDVSGMG